MPRSEMPRLRGTKPLPQKCRQGLCEVAAIASIMLRAPGNGAVVTGSEMIRLRWVFVATVLWAGASGVAQAADEYPFRDAYPFEASEYGVDLRETDRMKLGENAAPWLPPIIAALKANRPPMHALNEVVLFPAERDGAYLITAWRGGYMRESYVQFFRIETADGRRTARFLREIVDSSTYIKSSTGLRFTPSGSAVVVVSRGSGGMLLSGYSLSLILLARNTIDITPDWAGRLDGFNDIDGDGTQELIAYDDRWSGYFNGRSVAGPFLPIVLRVRRGRFAADCAGYEAVYRRLAGQYAAHAADEDAHPVLRSEAYGGQILALAQIGDIAGARDALARLESFYRVAGDKVLESLKPETVRADFSAAIAAAEKNAGVSCALSAAEASAEAHGALDRIEQFRKMGSGGTPKQE